MLSDGDRILSTAAPAGPAFEGGAIRCGMRAADGAIEVIRLAPPTPDGAEPVTLQVIGDVEPKGLCGSGLVDAVAELVRVGLLDATGRFIPEEDAKEVAPALADRLHEDRRGAGLRAAPPDARRRPRRLRRALAARRARAAVREGRDLDRVDAAARASSAWSTRDIQQVLLAGSFGSYLSRRLRRPDRPGPELPVLRIVAAGNVAGEGAKMALLSVRERAGAARCSRR